MSKNTRYTSRNEAIHAIPAEGTTEQNQHRAGKVAAALVQVIAGKVKTANLNEWELSSMTGIHYRRVRLLLNGKTPLRFSDLHLLADALNTTPSELGRQAEQRLHDDTTGEWHPSWCTRETDCYAASDPKDDATATAFHQRTYKSAEGVPLFTVEAVGTDTPEIVPAWASLNADDLTASRVLLQVYSDLKDVRPLPQIRERRS